MFREVSRSYALKYARNVYSNDNKKIIDSLNLNLNDKIVLDLGGGPGQFEKIFVAAGASKVFWHDRSLRYFYIAQEKHTPFKNKIFYVIADIMDLSYYEDVSIDFIFNRVSLYYASNEEKLIKGLYRILKKGGYLYIETHSLMRIKKLSFFNLSTYAMILSWVIQQICGFKIIHHPFISSKTLKKYIEDYFKIILFEEEGDLVKILAMK